MAAKATPVAPAKVTLKAVAKAPAAVQAPAAPKPPFREESLPGRVYSALADQKPHTFEDISKVVDAGKKKTDPPTYLPSILYGVQKAGVEKGFAVVYGDGRAQMTIGKKQDPKALGNSNTAKPKPVAPPKAPKAEKPAPIPAPAKKAPKAAPVAQPSVKKAPKAAPAPVTPAPTPAPVNVNPASATLVRRAIRQGANDRGALIVALQGQLSQDDALAVLESEIVRAGITEENGVLVLA